MSPFAEVRDPYILFYEILTERTDFIDSVAVPNKSDLDADLPGGSAHCRETDADYQAQWMSRVDRTIMQYVLIPHAEVLHINSRKKVGL